MMTLQILRTLGGHSQSIQTPGRKQTCVSWLINGLPVCKSHRLRFSDLSERASPRAYLRFLEQVIPLLTSSHPVTRLPTT